MKKIYYSETYRDCYKEGIGCSYLDGYYEKRNEFEKFLGMAGFTIFMVIAFYFSI